MRRTYSYVESFEQLANIPYRENDVEKDKRREGVQKSVRQAVRPNNKIQPTENLCAVFGRLV